MNFTFEQIEKFDFGGTRGNPDVVSVTKKTLTLRKNLVVLYEPYKILTNHRTDSTKNTFKFNLRIEYDDAAKALRLTPHPDGFSFTVQKDAAHNNMSKRLANRLPKGLYGPVEGEKYVYQLIQE